MVDCGSANSPVADAPELGLSALGAEPGSAGLALLALRRGGADAASNPEGQTPPKGWCFSP